MKTDTPEDFVFVYEIRKKDGIIWNSKKLASVNPEPHQWTQVRFDADLPEKIPGNAEFAGYFWISGKNTSVLYVDNLKLIFK